METAKEPQKKVFKARKTMKASDRQQLEAVHKAKEDLLKPTEIKLVNGIHENGDLDMNYTNNDEEPMEDTMNLNGILDLNIDPHKVPVVKLCDLEEGYDPHKVPVVKLCDLEEGYDPHKVPVVKLCDLEEGFKHVDQNSDLRMTLDLELNESTVCQDDSSKIEPTEAAVQACSPKQDDEVVPHGSVEQSDSSGLFLEDLACEPEFSQKQTQSNIPNEVESCSILEEESKLEDENPVEDSIVQKLNEDMDVISEDPTANADSEMEDSNIIKEPVDPEPVDSVAVGEKDDISEEQEIEASNEDLHSEIQNVEETENHTEEQERTEPVNESHDANVLPDISVSENGSPSQANKEISETEGEQQDIGDEAISSSMEVDHNLKNLEQNISLPAEAPIDKSLSEIETGSVLEKTDEMETDEIIPILEKLAPVEDELQCVSDKKEDFATVPNKEEEKSENIAVSPTKNDTNETLPSEAFLVLSDEEEPCGESTPLKGNALTDQDDVKEVIEEAEERPNNEQKEPENKEQPQAEKSEFCRRKRSKSEDLDSQSSKRRRFEGEEYEAELKVKITAGDNLNGQLQKVIQRMFEEKLSALQCLDFDKALADLKSRVEKIECKKHETALQTMQAKITRLAKRFGAAKEDLKKRPETTAIQPALPVKSAVNDFDQNTNTVNVGNAGTVRQILETKRSVGDTGIVNVPSSPTAVSSAPSTSNLTLRTSSTTQMPMSQSPASNALQMRPPPDWKLIQQKINASTIGASQSTLSSQSKPIPPVTTAPVLTPVLSASTTATVVGNSQVSTSNTQPVSVSLQSLPVILHVPVAVPSQTQLLQGTTGTLVTNHQSGNVEFIQVQNQSTVSNLTKTPVSLPVTKAMNSPSMSSSGIQRNSSANSMNSPMTVQAMPTHSLNLSSRQSLPNVGTSGAYNQASNRNTTPLKSPVSAFSPTTTTTSDSPSGSRSELQINRTPTAETTSNKRCLTDGTAQGGKGAAGVIDLTLDDEDAQMSTHVDSRRSNASSIPASTQSSQPMGRQLQQANTVQTSSASAGLPSQAAIHVLPTAQTTVNITQRPGTQTTPRAAAPRASSNPHMVYTTTALPTVPSQTPIRSTVMQSQNLRQISPQTGGVSVRMPQTAAYVVNNGMPISSTGPQLTVHHRPPQEPARPIHPAPLPEAPQPQRLPPEAASTSLPQKPHLKLARVQSQNGIVLSWSVLEVDRTCAIVDSYHLYAYHEDPTATSPSQWKKIGEVKALPLPMACTLTQFVSGSKYYFAVRAKDIYGRFGLFCDPQSTDVISTQSS
ncbi:activating transcription factor 7-interacting protein 1-like isoform X3 [Bufo gargarizans]|uniref:activating transcription factor 7-interacting protein 1-like isoform X3 n=1 Tax=Bufo gargarizans TaxID=30331 RepID=UPI001CF541EE|nr:activating transcription factor 7-interacting protein 1-like isoform X3 [Bufo gargarizans]